jgi:predicted solute-binding protein
VWAVRRSLDDAAKTQLREILTRSLESCDDDFVPAAGPHGRQIGLTDAETQEYLAGFNYRLGDRERKAMEVFRGMVEDLSSVDRRLEEH